MTAAQRLATATRSTLPSPGRIRRNEGAQTPTQRTITIGEAGSLGPTDHVALFSGIANANDVRCDVASNLPFCSRIRLHRGHQRHARPLRQPGGADGAGLRHLPGHRYTVPSPTITARLNFQLAFGARVAQRLAEAREQARQEATRDKVRAPGTAIALRNKEIELRDHYRSESRARGPGGPPAPRRVRRRPGGPVTERTSRPGWVPRPSFLVRARLPREAG